MIYVYICIIETRLEEGQAALIRRQLCLYIRVYICIDTCSCIYICICLRIYIHTHTHTYVDIFIFVLCIYVYVIETRLEEEQAALMGWLQLVGSIKL